MLNSPHAKMWEGRTTNIRERIFKPLFKWAMNDLGLRFFAKRFENIYGPQTKILVEFSTTAWLLMVSKQRCSYCGVPAMPYNPSCAVANFGADIQSSSRIRCCTLSTCWSHHSRIHHVHIAGYACSCVRVIIPGRYRVARRIDHSLCEIERHVHAVRSTRFSLQAGTPSREFLRSRCASSQTSNVRSLAPLGFWHRPAQKAPQPECLS